MERRWRCPSASASEMDCGFEIIESRRDDADELMLDPAEDFEVRALYFLSWRKERKVSWRNH